MTLKALLMKELQRLASAAGGSQPTSRLEVNASQGRLAADLSAVNQLACSLDQIQYTTDLLRHCGSDELSQIAGELSARLSYLLEPVRCVEVDQDACVVQLRSSPPEVDQNCIKYYELIVRRDEIGLVRYAKSPGTTRQRVPSHVTHEVLTRLGTDFVEVVEQFGRG